MKWPQTRIGIVTLGLILAGFSSAGGATSYWNLPLGTWDNSTGWNPNGLPASGTQVNVQNGYTVQIVQGTATCGNLYVSNVSSGTVQLIGGSLACSASEYIGYYGTGSFTQDNQSSHTTTASIFVGNYSSGAGTYQMKNGTLTVGNTLAAGGYSGVSGTFNQTGGTVTTSMLEVGFNSPGTWTISGGSDNVTNTINIGRNGGATFTVSGSKAAITCVNWNYHVTNFGNTVVYSQFDAGGISAIKVTGSTIKLGGTWNVTNPNNVAPYGKFNLLTASYAFAVQPGFTVNLPQDGTKWTWGYDSTTSPKVLWVQHGDPAAMPTFSPDGGTFSQLQSPITVTLSCATPNATIYFTTNGDPPTTASSSGTSVVISDNNTVLKAIAVAPGYGPSDVKTATYIFSSSIPSTSWSVADGDWSGWANWNYGVPAGGMNAYITNNGTCDITQSGAQCATLYLGNGPGNGGTVQMSGGSLTCTTGNEWIGYRASVTFNQTGGTNSLTGSGNYLYVGYNSASGGTRSSYTLTGAGVLTGAVYERIGYYDNGTFTQDNQSSHSATNMYLGMYGATGTYQMNNGTLAVDTVCIGNNGTPPGVGVFNQTGGNAAIKYLYVGYNSAGTYTISGGTDNSTMIDVGRNGNSGTFTVIGSKPAITCGGWNSDLTSFSGTVVNGQFDAGGISPINVTGSAKLGGVWNITNPGGVAPYARFNLLATVAGIAVQSGFVLNLPQDGTPWSWGYDNPTSPTILWVQHGDSVATPTFTPDGGTYSQLQLPLSVTISCTTPGATIYYTTDNTTPTTSQYTGSGASPLTISITGNTILKAMATAPNGIPSLVKTATYTFTTSTYWTAATDSWFGPSNWTAGVPAAGMTTYVTNNGTAQISAGSAECATLYLGNGTGSGGTVQLSGGSLTCSSGNNEYVGYKASATFNQTGGTNTVAGSSNYLYVGYNAVSDNTSLGTYNLTGTGVLNVGKYEYVGYYANGAFTQDNQSSHTVPNLYLGSDNATGTYQMNNGTLTLSGQLTIGNTGVGILNQTGGSITAGTLKIGAYTIGSGACTISGGTDNFTGLDVGVGGSTGTLTVVGSTAAITCKLWNPDVTNFAGSTLACQFDAGGISPINVTNNAVLGGTLTVTDPGHNAPMGRFNVLTIGGTLSGSFATVNLPDTATWSSGIDSTSTPKTVWVLHGLPAATPVLGPDNGVYFILTSPRSVTLNCDTPGAVIHYTLDGTDPTEASDNYTGPIAIDHSLTLKAAAWAPGYASSTLKVATFDYRTTYNQPATIPYGTVTLTGNADADFAGATWAPINRNYYSESTAATDVAEAWYTARWTEDTITVAIKVLDHNQTLNDSYALGWDKQDDVEIYLHTTGTGPTNYTANDIDAQQYTVGIKSSKPNEVWSVVGGGNAVPLWANFYATGMASNYQTTGDGWLYYEVVLTPFKTFSLTDSNAVVPSPLSAGDAIGLDVVVATRDWSDGFQMLSENLMNVPTQYKSANYATFGLHTLAAARLPGDANGDNRVTFEDFAILQNHYGESAVPYTNGDFDGNGLVNFADFAILQNHYGETGSAGTAPAAENLDTAVGMPCGTLGLVLLAIMGLGMLALKHQD